MADPQRSKNIFPFFDLPLELRENIYDMGLVKHFGGLACRGLRYEAGGMPLMKLLLLSKQFSQEYLARAKKMRNLLLEDTYTAVDLDKFKLPWAGAARTRLTVNIVIHPVLWGHEIEHHTKWLTALMEQLPGCSTLRLNIKVNHDSVSIHMHQLESFVCEMQQKSPVDMSTRIHGASRDEKENSGMQKNSVQIMVWSHETQKLERIPETESSGPSQGE